MTYPLSHRIDMRHKYTRSVDTDIRATFAKFAKFQNGQSEIKPLLDASPVPDSAPAGNDKDCSGAECGKSF